MSGSDVNRAHSQVDKAGMLKSTELIHDALKMQELPLEPIEYFEIPPHAHKIGKLVIPYVVIRPDGTLNTDLSPFYGVTRRPNAFDKEITEKRAREAHVAAEHLSLQRGIFTPYARASSEAAVSHVIPNAYLGEYIVDRTAHLHALQDEVRNAEVGDVAGRKDFVIDQLGIAITALYVRIDSINP